MKAEERAFLRALAMERGNPNAMHNIYVDDVLDKRRAEILAEINTAARALLGALSVSGEAPPKFCTKCYAPWNSDGYCPRGCGSAPPPEKEPRPDMTTLRGANLGDTTGAAPPKEPPAPPEEVIEIDEDGRVHGDDSKLRAAPSPETRSVEDSIRKIAEKLTPPNSFTCNDVRDLANEALRLYREENALWDREALRASDMILALRAERDDLERKGRSLCEQNGTLLMERHEAQTAIAEALRLIGRDKRDDMARAQTILDAALRGGKVERD